MIGPIPDPLNDFLDDLSLSLSLDDVLSKQPVEGLTAGFPGEDAFVFPLPLQAPLQGTEELGVLGLCSSPLNILWQPLEEWRRRGILRKISSRSYGV